LTPRIVRRPARDIIGTGLGRTAAGTKLALRQFGDVDAQGDDAASAVSRSSIRMRGPTAASAVKSIRLVELVRRFCDHASSRPTVRIVAAFDAEWMVSAAARRALKQVRNCGL